MNGAVQKMPLERRVIEPAADEQTRKRGGDKDPAQHADLRQTAAHGHVALLQPARAPVAPQPRFAHQRVFFGFGRGCLRHRNSPAFAPVLSRLIMRRMA